MNDLWQSQPGQLKGGGDRRARLGCGELWVVGGSVLDAAGDLADATVDGNIGACGEAGSVRGQDNRRVRDLLGRGVAGRRNNAALVALELLGGVGTRVG